MVKIDPPSGSFCIDETEVTQAQYDVFVKAKGNDLSGQPPDCADYNTSYVPSTTFFCLNVPYDPVSLANYPVVCVDRCDAAMYCVWAGKRLCRSFPVVADPFYPTPLEHEWLYACTQGGTSTYAYGNTPSNACAVAETTPNQPQPVKSFPNCHGTSPPFDAVYDLTGNVREWNAVCQDDTKQASTGCHHWGGTFGSVAEYADCEYGGPSNDFDAGAERRPDTGFRCCSDLAN